MTLYLVGKQRDISCLEQWRRSLVQFVYFVVGWHGADEVQFQTIATSEAIAREIVGDKTGWFIIPLPVDQNLPEEPVQYEEVPIYPHSDASERYRKEQRPLIAKPCAQIQAEEKGVEALTAQVDRIREKLKVHAVAL